MANPLGEVFTVKEAAQFLKCHSTTVYRLLNKGKIPAFRLGSDWRFRRDELVEWCRGLEAIESARESRSPRSSG